MKRILFVFSVSLIILFICNVGLCKNGTEKIQYDDYEWGMKKSEVKQKIKNKGHEIRFERPYYGFYVIHYVDKLFGSKSKVLMYFTKKTKQLYQISIRLDNYVYNDIKKIYQNKYGNPNKINIDGNIIYVWKNKNSLSLSNHSDLWTFLLYRSEMYEEIRNYEWKDM
ncbi:MAG: hypothetical protein K9K39_04375 [Desulfohalobiaceae bacterium]|nr:hypothetical protein [Desulfohalobiaceae bacterium]